MSMAQLMPGLRALLISGVLVGAALILPPWPSRKRSGSLWNSKLGNAWRSSWWAAARWKAWQRKSGPMWFTSQSSRARNSLTRWCGLIKLAQ